MEFLVFWLGLVLGSFLNVVAHRVPKGESVVRPRSRCPACKASIAWNDNIPLLSYALLRGRCRRCRKPISARYPAVELTMGLLAWGLWRRWEADPVWAGLATLAAGALLAVTLIDWDTFIIPDELSLGLLAAGLLIAPFNPYFASASWLGSLSRAFIGGVIGLGLGWGVAAAGEFSFKGEARGGGDIKLLAAVGAWTGGLGAFDCMMVGSVLGAAYGVPLLWGGKLKRYDPIPFGPFLSAAAVFNLFFRLPLGYPFL